MFKFQKQSTTASSEEEERGGKAIEGNDHEEGYPRHRLKPTKKKKKAQNFALDKRRFFLDLKENVAVLPWPWSLLPSDVPPAALLHLGPRAQEGDTQASETGVYQLHCTRCRATRWVDATSPAQRPVFQEPEPWGPPPSELEGSSPVYVDLAPNEDFPSGFSRFWNASCSAFGSEHLSDAPINEEKEPSRLCPRKVRSSVLQGHSLPRCLSGTRGCV